LCLRLPISHSVNTERLKTQSCPIARLAPFQRSILRLRLAECNTGQTKMSVLIGSLSEGLVPPRARSDP